MDLTITPAEMKALESAYMAQYGIASALLMEHAAQGVCAALQRRFPGGRALFLCGPGNNGGDGYAAARLWQAQGGASVIAELSGRAHGDALMNRTLAQLSGIPLLRAEDITDELPPCDVVVDALFGTGLSRPITGTAAELIRRVQASRIPVIAVDIPSGLDGETGRIWGCVLSAVETVTFHRLKPGLLLGSGADHAGQITVHPILIPQHYGTQEGLRCLTPDDLAALIPSRPVSGHKGTFGKAVILAGSRGMAGAAAFAANACIRAGAGLTTVLCRESILPIVQTLAPGAVCIPLPEADGRLTDAASALAADALHTATAAAIGPGLGQAEDMLPLLQLFAQWDRPVVWDADALNLLARHPALLPLPASAVITPHPGEAARLLNCATSDIAADPLEALHRLHASTGAHVLLKGARTLMTDGVHDAVNRFGTPAMGKGGSGDVLTGILTALLARPAPYSTLEAMQLAALIHGLAGLRAEKLRGENCVSPLDLIDCIRLDNRE